MAFKVGSIVGEIGLDTKKIKSGFNDATDTIKTKTVAIGTLIGNLAADLVRGVVNMIKSAASSVVGFLRSASQAASDFESAMIGLAGVAEKSGESFVAAEAAALGLAEDGLLSVEDAALGLKNLLAAGFGLEDSVSMMNVFKDSAAFGRQAALSFGEAVTSATEGIKNQNSILVDNAGVTKNLSVIMKEAGFELQALSSETEGAAARQALLNGLLKEGELFQGDAAKAAETLQGQQSKLKTATDRLKVAVGDLLNKAMAPLLGLITDLVGRTTDWVNAHKPEIFNLFKVAVQGAMTAIKTLVPQIAAADLHVKLLGLRFRSFVNDLQLKANILKQKGLSAFAWVPEVDTALIKVENTAKDALSKTKAHFVDLAEEQHDIAVDIIATTAEKERRVSQVEAVIAEQVGKANEKLEAQAAAFRDIQEAARGMPGERLFDGGDVNVTINNYPPPMTGTEPHLQQMKERQRIRDSGQRGDGPPISGDTP